MLSIRKLRKNKRNKSVSRYKQRGVVRRRARGPWCGRTGRKLSVQCTCTPPPPLQCRPMHANSVQGPAPHQSPHTMPSQVSSITSAQYSLCPRGATPTHSRGACAVHSLWPLVSSLHFTFTLHTNTCMSQLLSCNVVSRISDAKSTSQPENVY